MFGGGSSSVFRKAFCACTFMRSASTMTPSFQPFGAAVGPALLAAERHTALPLFVIPRWFRTSGPAQGLGWSWMSAPPSRETLEGYAQILARPRWIAMVGFTGRSRPWADLVGLMDMPATLAAVEQIVRGQ